MKYLTLLISSFVLLASFTYLIGIDDIANSIKKADVNQIAKYFDATVEITMPDKSNNYSKSQAELVLKDFFSTNGVKNFEVLHKGDNAGSQYCIGILSTKNGAFRTTIFMKQKGDKQFLQEIRFENM